MEKRTFEFRVDTNQLLNEIADCALPRTMGVFKIPLNVFKKLLARTAQRASEINDPELNIIMLQLTLYEVQPDKISDAIAHQKKLIEIRSNE